MNENYINLCLLLVLKLNVVYGKRVFSVNDGKREKGSS